MTNYHTARRQHSPSFKAKVVLELLRADRTRSEICSQYAIHPTQAGKWKQKALQELQYIYTDRSVIRQIKEKDKFIEELYRQIGELKVELDWLKKKFKSVA